MLLLEKSKYMNTGGISKIKSFVEYLNILYNKLPCLIRLSGFLDFVDRVNKYYVTTSKKTSE